MAGEIELMVGFVGDSSGENEQMPAFGRHVPFILPLMHDCDFSFNSGNRVWWMEYAVEDVGIH